LSKSFLAYSATFFGKSKGLLQAISKLALRAQALDIAYFALRQDL
jgi:hypothetical protein